MKMGGDFHLVFLLVLLVGIIVRASAAISYSSMKNISMINKEGPYLGIIVPNSFEMNPLLQSPSLVPHHRFPFFDFSGRRFRIGKLENEKVIIVMTGLGMLNAGIATELLLSLFEVKGVLHYGISGNANPELQIGDVTIPENWAHTGLWNWQRFGDGVDNELALESNGDYTRDIGYLNISYHNKDSVENLLNNVWYQPEEIFPISGTPEVRQHTFWVPIDKHYSHLAAGIEGMKLNGCVNTTTCLPRTPIVARVKRGISASIFVDNQAYRQFLNSKFNATPIDMETAAVALVCHQWRMPYIAFRSLSDLAGGGSDLSNEASVYASLAAQNAVDVLLKFVTLWSSQEDFVLLSRM